MGKSIMWTRAAVVSSCLCLTPLGAAAADLSPKTVAAFDKYVQIAERRMANEVRQPQGFLWVDTAGARKADLLAQLRRGEVIVDRVRADVSTDVPDGLLHHWVGTIFIPGVHVGDAVALLQDYDRHSTIFRPNVVQSKTLERRGDTFRVFLRFYMKKVIAVTLNSEHEARFTTAGSDRAYSAIHSTRIAEVLNAGEPTEREEQPGRGHGFMWRLNTYWRFLERDGGTYVQCESITLSRDMPFGLGWIIRPFITEVPKDSLTFTLEKTRAALAAR
jgi:hypothetical protein